MEIGGKEEKPEFSAYVSFSGISSNPRNEIFKKKKQEKKKEI